MKKSNLKTLSAGELEKKVSEMEESLRELRFKSEGARPKNVKGERSLRKEIARALTFLQMQKQHEH
ncbi:MAG: 50S ribosomal protein L29 [Patescibacteria group bacterium]